MEAAGIEPAQAPCVSKGLRKTIDEKARKTFNSEAKTISGISIIDPDLARIVRVWPNLSEKIKAKIRGMVERIRG